MPARRWMCRGCEPRRQQRMHLAQHAELQQATGHLRRADKRAHCHRDRQRRTGRLQQAWQMRCHRRADEPGRGKHIGQQDRCAARIGRRQAGLGGRGWDIRLDRALLGVTSVEARQRGIERQPEHQMQSGPGQAGTAPAPLCLEQCRQRPAHRARKACDQRDAGDRIARLRAVQAHQRREGGLVQTAAHAQADHHPGPQRVPRVLAPWPARTDRQRRAGWCPSAPAAPPGDRSGGPPMAPPGPRRSAPPRTRRTPWAWPGPGHAPSARPASRAGSTWTPTTASGPCPA